MSDAVRPTGEGSIGMSLELALKNGCERALLELALKRRLRKLWRAQHPPVKKRCPICDKILRNQNRTYCSKECICVHMTQRAGSPEYYAKREQQRRARLVTLHCKICQKDLGLRVPGSVTYCSRECVGKDPDIRRSKSEKRKRLWGDPEYRTRMSDHARARNADPTNGFGKNHPPRSIRPSVLAGRSFGGAIPPKHALNALGEKEGES